MAKLEIQLGADSAELLKGLADSEKQLKDWASRISSIKPKMSGAGIAQYSKETTAALNAEAIALAKATTETQQFKAAQAAAAAETAKFRNEKSQSSKVITENSRLYKQLSQRLTEMRKNAQDVGAQFGVNSTQFLKAAEGVQRLDGRLKAIDGSLGSFQRNVGNYQSALKGSNTVSMEFARIIQDAPFGIMGVGNNIQQLTANYAQYANSVKQAAAEQGKSVSQGQILKGALSGLLSPMSLLTLGIAAVTSGWTLYTMWSQKSAKAARDASKEAKKSSDEYVNSLDQLTQARLKGEQSAQSDITTLRALYKVYTDGNAPLKSRQSAYEQLQSIYPDYFKNIKFEQTASEQTKLAYDKLTTSILATARARAAGDLITKNATRQLENEQKITDLQAQKEKEIVKTEKLGLTVQKESLVAKAELNLLTTKQRKILQDYNNSLYLQKNLQQQINNLNTDSNILTERNLNLEKQVSKEIEKGAVLGGGGSKGSKDKLTDAEKRAEKIAEIWKKLSDELKITNADIQSSIETGVIGSPNQGLFDKAKEDLKSYQKAWEDLIKLGFKEGSKELATLTEQILLLKRVTASGDLLPAFSTAIPSAKIPKFKQPEIAGTGKEGLTDEQKFIQRSIRTSITNVVNESISALSQIGEKNLEIEKKYSELRRDATKEQIALYDQMEKLEKSVSTGLLATINGVFGSLNKGINDIFVKSFSDSLSKIVAEGEFKLGGLTSKTSQALVAGASIAGGIISGMTSKTSAAGQGVGGAISGAATGAAIGVSLGASAGPWGAIAGALLGGLAGIFSASKAKKQEELQKQQVELQKRQLDEQKRANALAYSSAIIGQMTNQGLITGIDRDAFGNIVGRISGQDLLLIVERTQKANKRG